MAGNKYSKKAFVILCAAIVVFTFAGCKKETPEADVGEEIPTGAEETFVIELGVGVGPVKFGMSEEQVIEAIGQPDKVETVMPDVVRLNYISSRGLLLGLNPTAGINYIKCYSKEYPGYSNITTFAERTKKGVAMGASRNQITAVYGEPDSTASKEPFTILYYDNLRSEMIITNDRLVGIKMVNQL